MKHTIEIVSIKVREPIEGHPTQKQFKSDEFVMRYCERGVEILQLGGVTVVPLANLASILERHIEEAPDVSKEGSPCENTARIREKGGRKKEHP